VPLKSGTFAVCGSGPNEISDISYKCAMFSQARDGHWQEVAVDNSRLRKGQHKHMLIDAAVSVKVCIKTLVVQTAHKLASSISRRINSSQCEF
jgi:hypothetical protein